MTKVVVDVSCAVKWFVPEIHSAASARLLEGAFILNAPDLIVPEFGNVLWKKVRRAEITREEADEILSAFRAVPIEIQPSTVLLPAALALAVRLDRTVYDSLYLALAVAGECVMVTADRKLFSVVQASPLADHIRWVEGAF